MTDAPCARPGCGHPKVWHYRESTVAQLDAAAYKEPFTGGVWAIDYGRVFTSAACLLQDCACRAYLAPETPRPDLILCARCMSELGKEPPTGPRCSHCGYGIHGIRNPSGYCDHLYYPEYCVVCTQAQKAKSM